MKLKRIVFAFASVLLISCASFFKGFNKKELNERKEFDQAIQVEEFKEDLGEAKESENKGADKKSSSQASKADLKAQPSVISSGKPDIKTSAKKKGAPRAVVRENTKKSPPPSAAKKKGVVQDGKAPPPRDKKLEVPSVPPLEASKTIVKGDLVSGKASAEKVSLTSNSSKKAPLKKVPPLEDAEGFMGRRPIVDPLHVGEKIVLSINFFKVEAGRFTLSVKPFKKVNGKKSYHLHYTVKTSSLFSMFYKVDDVAETFDDYDLWRPFSYEIHVKQSKQVRETKSFFDWKTMKGVYLDRKKAPDKPMVKSKREWDVKNWSQNVFSVAYYLRAHTLKVGKTLKVRVGHEGKNLVMSAKVLRKEKIKTAVGEFEAFVVQPTFTVDGLFKATGSNLIWLSADDRKFFLRLESKIKIGTIVGQIEELKR